ncbi:MAG: hypothetical protein HW412_218 [Bacteroidetes bacterium]|nr:hypothetical protein [Bacteroidota bacterium]
MIVKDVQKIIEGWAPKEIAWERDNVGLQVGSQDAGVRSILVCLDVNEDIIREALKRRANLIVSHHPLLFKSLRSVDLRDATGRCVSALLTSKITLYSAHTNLDFTSGGTSFALADRLALTRVDFLMKSYRLKKKIVTFVPPEHVDRVAEAMSKAGAGRIGNYELCSYRGEGSGTFRGNTEARPTVGKRGQLEHVQEVRLEMLVDQPSVQPVVRALLNAHPYEEVAYDVYPLENVSPEYGMGIIGNLSKPMTVPQFIRHVKKALKASAVRYTLGATTRVRRVAACGGSGSELTDEAIRQNADAFVTADVKYHSFHDAARRILLVDAGHYETERPVVDALARKLSTEFKRIGMKIPVYAAQTSTNPILTN